MTNLKKAISLVNVRLSKVYGEKSPKANSAIEFENGWWISFPDNEFGGLYFVVKSSGDVIWGNPPPLEYIIDGETGRLVSDDEFNNASD